MEVRRFGVWGLEVRGSEVRGLEVRGSALSWVLFEPLQENKGLCSNFCVIEVAWPRKVSHRYRYSQKFEQSLVTPNPEPPNPEPPNPKPPNPEPPNPEPPNPKPPYPFTSPPAAQNSRATACLLQKQHRCNRLQHCTGYRAQWVGDPHGG